MGNFFEHSLISRLFINTKALFMVRRFLAWDRNRTVFFGALIAMPTLALADEGASGRIEALNSRSRAIRTFQADVTVRVGPGDGVTAYRNAREKWALWLQSHGHADAAKNIRSDLRDGKRYAFSSETYRCRYAFDANKGIRVDEPAKTPETVYASVYSNGRWGTLLSDGSSNAQLTIQNDHWPLTSATNLEVARGAGVQVSNDLIRSGLPISSVFGDTVSWAAFAKEIIVREADQSAVNLSKSPEPLFEAVTRPFSNKVWPNLNLPLCVYEITLDSKANLTPVYLKCTRLIPHKDFAHEYITDSVVDWSSPDFSQDGSVVFKNCNLRFFTEVPAPPATWNNDRDFPNQSYEVQVHTVVFSNIKINAPIDASVFKLVPPEGTSVIDMIAGERYVVGQAGEALRRTALRARNSDFVPPTRSVTIWRIALIGINLAVVVSVIFVLVRRHRHSGTKLSGKP